MVRQCSAVPYAKVLPAYDTSDDPKLRHAPGIYVLTYWVQAAKLQPVKALQVSRSKVAGNGSLLFPSVSKLIFSDPKSSNVVKKDRPSFYFYFDTSNDRANDFGFTRAMESRSPQDFTLINVIQKDRTRETLISKTTIFSASSGMDAKHALPFIARGVSPGIFHVTPANALVPGEYAFVSSNINGSVRVYDFSVARAPLR